MKTRLIGMIGLATLGLALAVPVQAAPDFLDGAFMVAKRDQGEETRQDQRDARKDKRRGSKQREAGQDESQGYGYGYERRQQERFEEDERRRGRR